MSSYLTFQQLSDALPDNARDYLAENPAIFDKLAADTSIIIRDITGEDIPGDNDDAPDWVFRPFVWIIIYLYVTTIQTGPSEIYLRQITTNYNEAEKLLKLHKKSGTLSSVEPASGRQQGLYHNAMRIEIDNNFPPAGIIS